jgi:hypothetical protein
MVKPTLPDFSDIQQQDEQDDFLIDDSGLPLINRPKPELALDSIASAIEKGWSQAEIERRLTIVNLSNRCQYFDECVKTFIKNETI